MGDPVKSLRIALIYQVALTILLMVLSAWLVGVHGAISALLGGLVAMAGGLVFILLAPLKNAQTQSVKWRFEED